MEGNRDSCCPQWICCTCKVRESLMKKVMSELRHKGSEMEPNGSRGDRAPGRVLRSECAWCDGHTELERIDKAVSFTDRSAGKQASSREMASAEWSRCQEGNTDGAEAPKRIPNLSKQFKMKSKEEGEVNLVKGHETVGYW